MIRDLFSRRWRGFKIVEVAAAGVLIALMLGVYLAKTGASRDSNAIVRIEKQIIAERAKIRMLQADVAKLEAPERIEALSTQYLGLGPVKATREAAPEELATVAAGAVRGGRP